jgi:hypothetical protein
MKKWRARLRGISKKAFGRKTKRCEWDQSKKSAALTDFDAATTIIEYRNEMVKVMNERTEDGQPPECKRIKLFLTRKINKIMKRIGARN